ncbi:MAG: cell division protein FtsH [Rhodopirellula sp.]|nr:cell division protein FtsH [Rhodopirellula sp.]
MKNDESPTDQRGGASSQQPTFELTATAWHEAGHAVMAISLGRPIEKVTISPAQMQTGGSRLGVCKIQKGRSKGSNDRLEDDVLILLAGMVAESRFTGRYCTAGAAQDLAFVEQILSTRAANDRQLERLTRRMLDKTEHVLADQGHAKAIEAIAQELVAKVTISGRSVRHFFELAMKQSAGH